MTDEEFQCRVRIVARQIVLGEAALATDRLMMEIDKKFLADKRDNVSITLTIHLGTIEAFVRSQELTR